ncbi:MAG: helix-turn-helix domain-containing protein [Yaniella sp.]|nr:helix-turn-helix domain-containing protein [Yaniella sp.]
MMTDEQAVARNFDEWGALVSTSFVTLNAEPVRSGAFSGRIVGQRLGDLVMTRIAASPHAVLRSSESISSDDNPHYKLSFQRTGYGLLMQDGREVVIGPGQFAIYDTSRPYILAFDKTFATDVLMFPRGRLGLDERQVSQMTATLLGEQRGLSSAVAQFVTNCGQMLPELNQSTGHSLASNVIDLLRTVLSQEMYSSDSTAHMKSADKRKASTILRYIHDNLAEQQLTPKFIADAHFMSLRSLHHLFEKTGNTVAATIRTLRLERCRNDLTDPGKRETPVASIGARWGIVDPAHFSRIFRQAYGVSPTVYRKQH